MVQGVGFRPFVYRLAHRAGRSPAGCATTRPAWSSRSKASATASTRFVARLASEAPPLARVDARRARATARGEPAAPASRSSRARAAARPPRSAPTAPCAPTASRELFDAGRPPLPLRVHQLHALRPALHHHARLPYDRAMTSMAAFRAVPALPRRVHAQPRDRRFHAEPNACPVCGPRLALLDDVGGAGGGRRIPIAARGRPPRAGEIVAIKGLGGFHLACDARNADGGRAAAARARRARRSRSR